MKTTLASEQTTNGNELLTSIDIEIEELEAIIAPEGGLGKIATNHNETFVCDEEVEFGA